MARVVVGSMLPPSTREPYNNFTNPATGKTGQPGGFSKPTQPVILPVPVSNAYDRRQFQVIWLSRSWRDLSTDFADYADLVFKNRRNQRNLRTDFRSFPLKTVEPVI